MTTPAPPQIDYTNRDYASLSAAMLANASTPGGAGYLPNWTSRSTNDFGVAFIQNFAYLGDIVAYYIDRVANESYLQTAQLRGSLLNIAGMLDYRPDSGQPATVQLMFTAVAGTGRILIPAGTQVSTAASGTTAALVFETNSDLYIDQVSTGPQTGTVAATQGTTVAGEALGNSDGSTFQMYTLAQSPVIDGSVTLYVDEGAGPQPWVFVEHLIDAGPNDRVFTSANDANGSTSVEFGDGVNGRPPYSGSIITATYRIGGGLVTNVGVGTITVLMSPPTGVSTVTNQVAGSGGTDPESNDDIRRNAAKSFSALLRGVSLADYAALALGVGQVIRASADGLTYQAITVYIAPSSGGAPTSLLKQQVLNYLQDKKMVNANVAIADPTYVPINISASVVVAPEYSQSSVIVACQGALVNLLSLSNPNVDFGMTVSVSDVYQALNSIDGVIGVTPSVVARASSETQNVADVVLAVNELPNTVGVLSVDGTGGISASTGGASGSDTSVQPGTPGAPVIDSLTAVSDPTVLGEFLLNLHWAGVADAQSYAVIIDFYDDTTYVGSLNGGNFTGTTASIQSAFASTTADTMVVHIRAINGQLIADGPSASTEYTEGENTPSGGGSPPVPTFVDMSVACIGGGGSTVTLTWDSGVYGTAYVRFSSAASPTDAVGTWVVSGYGGNSVNIPSKAEAPALVTAAYIDTTIPAQSLATGYVPYTCT